MKRLPGIAAATILLTTLAACGSGSDGGTEAGTGRLQLVTGSYPLEFVIGEVGGDRVQVSNVTQPGADPHDLELTPQQVGEVSDADLVVYQAGFQPALDAAVDAEAADRALDVTGSSRVDLTAEEPADGDHAHESEEEHAAHAHGPTDPHFWLDPTRLADTGDAVAERLTELDPENAASYEQNAQALRQDLTALDEEFRTGLATCTSRDLVTAHQAFGYLADRYDLHQVGIAGVSPEAEPSPRQMADLVEHVRQTGVTTLYTETLISPAIAETIAQEAGVRTAVLDPLEGLTSEEPDADYISVMQQNLQTLRTGQGCS